MSVARAVRVACPDCEWVALPSGAVKVHVSRVNGAGARFSFVCPKCHAWVMRDASHADTKKLLAAGCACDVVPREVLEQPESHIPAIGDADVDGFLAQLEAAEFPALVAMHEGAR